MKEELYKENILEHYKNPQNKGLLKGCNHESKGANPVCGDVVILYVLEKDGVIQDVRFDGEGCAISTAATSMLTERIKGMSIKDVKEISPEDIFEMLGVSVGPTREKCALLSLNVLIKLVKQI